MSEDDFICGVEEEEEEVVSLQCHAHYLMMMPVMQQQRL